MKYKTRIAWLITVVTVVAGVGTAAYASIPDGSGVIHACYQSPPPEHGAPLNVIDTGAGGNCSGGHVALTWNQTGPQGPAGAAGATGATGPQGPPGVSGYQLEQQTQTLTEDTETTFTVTCAAGEVPTGGGYHTQYPSGHVAVGDDYPVSNGWVVRLVLLGNTGGSYSKDVTVYAVCVDAS
jgi:hypothetical protein